MEVSTFVNDRLHGSGQSLVFAAGLVSSWSGWVIPTWERYLITATKFLLTLSYLKNPISKPWFFKTPWRVLGEVIKWHGGRGLIWGEGAYKRYINELARNALEETSRSSYTCSVNQRQEPRGRCFQQD